MPFGLKNACAIFQRRVMHAFVEYLNNFKFFLMILACMEFKYFGPKYYQTIRFINLLCKLIIKLG